MYAYSVRGIFKMLGLPDFTEVNMHIGGIDELYAPEFRNTQLVRTVDYI